MWGLIVSVSDHCLSFYFENVIFKLLFLSYMHTNLYFSFYHTNSIDMHYIIHKYKNKLESSKMDLAHS